MGLYDPKHRFRDYLELIKKSKNGGKCWLCHKSEEDIKAEFYEYMKKPDKQHEDINFDDLIIITYKMKKPMCAGCYFAIRQNVDIIKEILTRSEKDIWSE